MKKRAQQPDAYTFTILLRGLSWYPQFSHSITRALSIYQSMFADNCPVRPSIIHTNAVLKVCALAHDVDALLRIAAELPTRGNGAPNYLTFTIILNAIRGNALEPKKQTAISRKEDTGGDDVTALAVKQGRRLWVEVTQRWMSGDLHMDEEFVCAMGRLLLLGSEVQNQDDVLSLLEQTMGIPRQVARIANPALRRANEASGPTDDPELPPCSPANVELKNLLSPSNEEDEFPELPSHPFDPLPNVAGPSRSAVRPGRNTLSLVLDACIRLKYARAAQNYWGILTSPDGYHKIIPDSENYHMYLRVLRLQRASKLAVELVDEMRSGDLTGKAGAVQLKTFRIALSCCVRDSRNRHSILHGAKLVRMMTDSLPYPDAKALNMYLQIALSQKSRDWRTIMGVIRGTELGVRNLRSLLAFGPTGPQKQNEEDILELVGELIRAFDVVLDLGNEEISGEEKRRCRKQRHTLAAYVTRMHNRLLAEGKRVGVRKGEDEGTCGKVTPSRRSRSGRAIDEHHKADEEGEDGGFEGKQYGVVVRRPAENAIAGPGEGEWNREWKMGGGELVWETKDRDRERMSSVRACRLQGGRSEERVERY